MKILAIDRSTDVQSVAFAAEGVIASAVFEGADSRSADWPVRVKDFLAEHRCEFCDLDKIVIGIGPGSFAGIRGALSFAQGLALGIKSKRQDLADSPVVYGLASPVAMAEPTGVTAVVGDARRRLFWVAVYDGVNVMQDLHLVSDGELASSVPQDAVVVTPDCVRIGGKLEEVFGARFAGGRSPSAERLASIALAHPELLKPEPLPVYLSPAVRT